MEKASSSFPNPMVGLLLSCLTAIFFLLSFGPAIPVYNHYKQLRLTYGTLTISKNRPINSVCGTVESFQYLAEGRSCYGKTKKEAKYDLTSCPWPQSSILETLDYPEELVLNPIPGSHEFINFSIPEMRLLLKDKTIIIVGDSTSRRLYYTLCNLLTGNELLPLIVNGKSRDYTAKRCTREDIHKALRINLIYSGATKFSDFQDFYKGITKHFSPGATVHAFVPFVSFHLGLLKGICVDEYTSNSKLSQVKEDYKKCQLSPYLGEAITQKIFEDSTPRGVSCALAAKFFSKCSETRRSIMKNDHASEVFFHGLSNVAVAKTGDSSMFHDHTSFFSYEPVLSAYSLELDTERCSDFQEFITQDSHCDFVDMTTWMMKGKHWTENITTFIPELDRKTQTPRRHDCLKSEGDQALHVMNEQGQLMRIQTILNTIFQSENKRQKVNV